jgi:hypothetical protein
MKRLFNEYEAQVYEDCKPINDIIDKAIDEVIEYCKANNLSLRDAESVFYSNLSGHFAYHVLKKAFYLKKSQRENVIDNSDKNN